MGHADVGFQGCQAVGHRSSYSRDLLPAPSLYCPWVFGIRERSTSKCYFEIVSSRDRASLLQIILKRVHPESIIFSDSWSAYNDIVRLDANFRHEMVNHHLNFVNPGTDVHTNGIESLWNSAKRRFKQMNGCARQFIQAYLNEFCWRKAYCDNEVAAFDYLLSALHRHFPLGSKQPW